MAEFKRRDSRKPSGGRNNSGGRRFDSRGSGRFDRRGSGGFSRRIERTEVTCDACKKRCEVPFKPSSDKPIYCDDCFRKESPKRDSGSRSNNSSRELSEINNKLDKIMEALEID